MKRVHILLILVSLITAVIYSNTPEVKGEIKSTYGVNFDYDQVRSGLKEDFNFDIVWPLVPYEHSSKGEQGDFRVETSLTGALDFTILDHGNGWTQDTEPTWTVHFSNIYSKIYLDSIYFLVGARDTNYEHADGYTISTSADKIRANWAALTSRVAWSYLLTPDYNISQDSDYLNGIDGEQGSESSIGLGGDVNDLSWLFLFGTQNDWTVDEDNRFDLGYNVSFTGIPSLTINQGLFTRIQKDENVELGAGLGLEYKIPLTGTLVIKPNVGADIFITDLENTTLQGTEIAYGITVEWPGAAGYGDSHLQESSNNKGEFKNQRYSGLTISGINYIDGDDEENDEFNLKLSLVDTRDAGLIPGLEIEALVEIVDVTKIADDEHNLAFGLYADYTVADFFRPKVHGVMRTIDSEDRSYPIELSVGVDYVGLNSTTISLVYENDNLSEFEEKPGRVLLSVTSSF